MTTENRAVPERRDNSLNLVRLVLALMVLVSHAYAITGHGDEPTWQGKTLGTWAVYGFFALSGFLITGSRVGSPFGSYLVRRIARIYPGFLACLVVTITVFAPIAYAKQHHGLGGYLTTSDWPLNYVVNNLTLKVFGGTVAGTLSDAPFPGIWNGSLWTLYYEFMCYLIVGTLLALPFMRRRPLLLAPVFVGSVVFLAHPEWIQTYFGGHLDVIFLTPLLPFFLGGSVVWLLRDAIPLHWYVALPAAGVFVGAVLWREAWGGQAAAPLLAIVLLWLGQVLPSPAWIRRNDLSYGAYVYAFPVQQLVVLLGLGVTPFANMVTAAIGTGLFAAASWFVVERPAMRSIRGSISGVDVTLHHDHREPARQPAAAAAS
ncbi:acyltransferase [Nocardioides islandensis]|jgi:peptidoglycan/LPS O-acetylase OafA/YrhL|uniref:Acyltransferase n=1 Tax=Nocardioides islandensis TaxID=433663 RepID=A0A930VFB3_9ACTN|nr:acyltransferase [Nocardioides islandensis]MBF4765512.1 acyltransferase [Nocardioides islandensis]